MESPGYLIKRAQDLLHAAMLEELRPLPLCIPEYVALLALSERPGSSNADLARQAFVTPQSMHKVLADLEESGLVVRRPHPDHGRVLQTELTSTGRHRLAAAHEAVVAVERRMLASLPLRAQRQLVDSLNSCITALAGSD